MELHEAFQLLGISLAMGLLVGLQRERVKSPLAGLRTFALITVLGTICGMLSLELGGWVIAAGILGVSAAMVVGNIHKLQARIHDPGVTTEIAGLLMFALGAYLVYGHREVVVVLGGAVAVLLYSKPFAQRFVRRMGAKDMRGAMQFALIALVIWPVLPNEPYGPFAVLNPREIWSMVVLVAGISFGGYVAYKLFGERAGTVVAGLLGGVISSTATTVSYSRRAAEAEARVWPATLAIMLASTVVYARVLVEIAVAAPRSFAALAPPVAVMMGGALVVALFVWVRHRGGRGGQGRGEMPLQESPTELKSALIFGALYAVVLFAVAASKHYFNDRGIYVVAGLSGLTDMDAITLSTSRLVSKGELEAAMAWRAIVIATIANLFFKAGIAGALGGPRLLARIGPLFAINALVGIALLIFWPTAMDAPVATAAP